jgi:hypothetical protein
MNSLTRTLVLVCLLGCTANLFSQTDSSSKASNPKRHFFKVNLAGISINGQYEWAFAKRFSIAVGYRALPQGKMPFRKLIPTTDATTRESLDNLIFSSSSFTPEIRFYTGKKGYGQGFYLSPFYKKAEYKAKGLGIDYVKDNGETGTMNMNGSIKGETWGLLLGAQWALGKHFCLDWQILGPHIGRSSGGLFGVSTNPLSISEQADMRQSLQDINIPFTEETVTVDASRSNLELRGPWAGIRAGVSLGFRF